MSLHRPVLPHALACLLVGTFAATVPGPARAEVYRCESDNGVPVYKGTANGKNCRAIDLQPLTTIPTPKLPVARPGSAAGTAAAARPSPEAFPKVDAAAQRARDSDRRHILEDELQKEEARLAELRSVYKDGQPDRLGNERNYQRYLDRVGQLKSEIGRSEANIASIRRELGATKD